MKAVTLSLAGVSNPQEVKKTLDALSAVLTVDIHGDNAVVHCGRKLDTQQLVRAASKAGYPVSILSEREEIDESMLAE